MQTNDRYTDAENYLRDLDEDWAHAIDLIGPCRHDPKAAREPYEALIRAIAYQQLTAKAGDAILARLKALRPDDLFPAPDAILAAEFDTLRACGFSASKIATIKTIAEGSKSGLVPSRQIAASMEDDALISRISTVSHYQLLWLPPGVQGFSACLVVWSMAVFFQAFVCGASRDRWPIW